MYEEFVRSRQQNIDELIKKLALEGYLRADTGRGESIVNGQGRSRVINVNDANSQMFDGKRLVVKKSVESCLPLNGRHFPLLK